MPTRTFETAAPLIPEGASLEELHSVAMGCTACHLHKLGTQTVFGEGPPEARALFVGEQPGDREDLAGEPFVGPAGGLLSKALDQVGIDRGDVYVTNVVKHFKWEPRGKRRIHKKPNMAEITACKPWLEAEIDVVRPDIVVMLGSTAAQALLGRDFKVTQQRGTLLEVAFAPRALATIHPSAILRGPDEARATAFEGFVADLDVVAKALQGA